MANPITDPISISETLHSKLNEKLKKPPKLTTMNKMNKVQIPKNIDSLKIGCWNIRRGLLKRELEIVNLIEEQKLDVLTLVETDTMNLNSENDYVIKGFKTILPTKKDTQKTRLIMLISDKQHNIHARRDLMTSEFPSIWCEENRENEKNVLICGFYREWSTDGIRSAEAQKKSINLFTDQIEKASKENKSIIILGDANLCALRWEYPEFGQHLIAEEILGTLAQCGLTNINLGVTYQADRLSEQGDIIEGALDHAYISNDIIEGTCVKKLQLSSTDHVPIVAELKYKIRRQKPKPIMITKRCMKNFNINSWNQCLATKNWNLIAETEDVDLMAKTLSNNVNSALDDCAPTKTIRIKPTYIHGLQPETKATMAERDKTRNELKYTRTEKWILLEKYRKLRNRATALIQEDKLAFNSKRIDEANSEGEFWKIVNDISKPKTETIWKLETDSEIITDNKKVADELNHFFVDKIANLKESIDSNLIEEPLDKLRQKMADKNLNFTLKTVTERTVSKVMRSLKKKKSKGEDGISQDVIMLGEKALLTPITYIINASIASGTFPNHWKKAVVIPILKKGSPTDKNNYRPISIVNATSKILEKIVCNQLTKHMEKHKLLPNNQHGFRAMRSTMTALSAMQKDWVRRNEDGLITGVLIWDLSAAFDTVNTDLLCEKLKIYGCNKRTCAWFHSFLTDRSQQVKIGTELSIPLKLTSGVPQGGILSPMIFTIYTSDLQYWVKKAKIFNYADDTTSSCSAKQLKQVLEDLEEDADTITKYMASNGLIANHKKTVFMLINNKEQNSEKIKIRVGNNQIEQESNTKLLGMNIQDNLGWKEHFTGKNGLFSCLNKRLFAIRRVKNHVPKDKLPRLAHSLWTSKLRYGLQLCSQIRTKETDSQNTYMQAAQVAQNKMLRLLDNSTLSDRVPTVDLLKRANMLSVNQLAANIKLNEAWKANNIENYPIQLEANHENLIHTDRITRPHIRRLWKEDGKTTTAKESFSRSTAKLWNQAPQSLKESKSLTTAKKAIREYCKTLPI